MQKILAITRVIMRRVHWIFKIRRGRMRRRRRRRRKWLLRIVLKLTPERATTTLKTTTVRKQKAKHCENTKVYGTLIMKCPNCFWHDYYKICPICDHQIPEERNYIKEGFLRCHDCGAITHKKAKTLETNFYSPLKRRTKKRINSSFLPNRCVFDSFCRWFSIKFLKRYLVSGFIVSVY